MKYFWIVATVLAFLLFLCSIRIAFWWKKNRKGPGLAGMISRNQIVSSMIVLGVIAVICFIRMMFVIRK